MLHVNPRGQLIPRSEPLPGAPRAWMPAHLAQADPFAARPALAFPPPALIAPSLLNSWANFGGSAQVAGYLKDAGYVHLTGVVKDGTATPGTVIFTLPSGYRPAAEETFVVASNGAYGECVIQSDGDVTINAGSNTSFSLCGIAFRVA